ncbi:Zinc finger protein 664 [Sciurus carolinensis]|uniref:Zinc finger protein 664 n=1 Tax=Sciurus carolinensis TaxID=30640 RepID=A0AA41T8S3_SCICA|nr:Zinc finger protein 664 [Sciurus carolinensis]
MIYKCPMCREFFSERADLFVHQKIHMAEKPHKCDKCDKGFFHISELHIHWRDHTGEKVYKCDDCGKDFSTTTKLNRHKKIHTVEKPYKCYEYGKAFNWSSHLQIHMRVHTDIKNSCGGTQGMFRRPKIPNDKNRKQPMFTLVSLVIPVMISHMQAFRSGSLWGN